MTQQQEQIEPHEGNIVDHATHQLDARLIADMFNGGKDAELAFYQKYLRLVGKMSRQAMAGSINGVVDFDDVSQEAWIHVLGLASNYSPDRNANFSTYIHGSYLDPKLRNVVNKQYGAKIDSRILHSIDSIMAINAKRISTGQTAMTDADIAEELQIPLDSDSDSDLTVAAIRRALLMSRYMGSIDEFKMLEAADFDGIEDSTDKFALLAETSQMTSLTASSELSVEEKVTETFLREQIDTVLGQLNPRHEQAIRMHFGLDGQPKTNKEIGKEMGISGVRVSQIIKKALENLRKQSQQLRDF